jgi:hypothetical protein
VAQDDPDAVEAREAAHLAQEVLPVMCEVALVEHDVDALHEAEEIAQVALLAHIPLLEGLALLRA